MDAATSGPAGTTTDPAGLSHLTEQFERVFGPTAPSARVRVVRAPGRVNLIGEHTDYNDGFVLPMAIEPEVRIAFRPRDDGRVRVATTLYPDDVAEFSPQHEIAPGEPMWANYVKGPAAVLLEAGVPLTGGMDALLANTLPPGGGLSSSAAVEVGTTTALLALAGVDMDPQRVALLCQKAEHEYAGVPVGIMDQTIVACGRAGHAMLLDCRDLSKRFVPVDAHDVRVVIVNSMVKHELTGGEYAERRRQCEEGVAHFRKANPDIMALRDVSMRQVEEAEGKLPEVVFRRCRHVVAEIARTAEAADRLARRDYAGFGRLMVHSHASLRDDYEVSVVELDYLVEKSVETPGVYGARMTGGGFGGCIVALVRPDRVETLIGHLRQAYSDKFGIQPVAFVTTATAGAGTVE